MPNTTLLLDSTRPVCRPMNTNDGCPKINSAGVLESCHVGGVGMNKDSLHWYALRATYSRELKVRALLDDKGVRTFVPMMWRRKTMDGKIEMKLVPAVNNLCFVYWSRREIDGFIKGFGENPPANYYWDRALNRPLTVPDKAMEDFITVASSYDEDIVYLTEVSDKLREGQMVEVTDGPFKGVKGRVVRIRKNRRILVELPGFLAVTTNYIEPSFLKLEEDCSYD